VDGTLIQAWAGHKSFVPKDDRRDGGCDGGDFKGQRRSNDMDARVRHQPPQVLDLYRASLLACHYNKDI
jgi:hypothetical protein